MIVDYGLQCTSETASALGLWVSWPKMKLQNLGTGTQPTSHRSRWKDNRQRGQLHLLGQCPLFRRLLSSRH